MNNALTAKQQKVYAFIRDFIDEKKYAPTLKEIVVEINVKATNTAVKYLKALEKKGYISCFKHAKRGISLKNNEIVSPIIQVPVVASVGCDDLSVFGNDRHDEFLHVDKKLVGDKFPIVAVRAVGDSMSDAGIQDGDYVLVHTTNVAENGERVVAVVGDIVTVKRLEKKEGLTVLWPESNSPKYRPIIMSDDFKVAGKVICTVPGNSMNSTELTYEKII